MKLRLLFALFFVITLLFALPACTADNGKPPTDTEQPEESPEQPEEEPVLSFPPYEPADDFSVPCLSLELTAPAELEKTLPVTLSVVNTCDEAYSVIYEGRDLLAVNKDGLVMWRWGEYAPRPSILFEETLAPGASLDFTMEWGGFTVGLDGQTPTKGERADAGVYTLVGQFDLEKGRLETHEKITVK